MKPQHRRAILRDVVALLAIPLTLRPRNLLRSITSTTSEGQPNDERADTPAVGLRPRVSAPNGSVMRRG